MLYALLAVVVAAGIIALVVSANAGRRRRRDLEMSQQWDAMQAAQLATPQAALVEVITVYQPARRGTKAIVRWLASGYQQDTWFQDYWPEAGAIALVRGTTGWGPHNQNPSVFYVRPDQILYVLPPGAGEAARRHREREARRAG